MQFPQMGSAPSKKSLYFARDLGWGTFCAYAPKTQKTFFKELFSRMAHIEEKNHEFGRSGGIVMSTLQTISEMIGKAMHLPDFFYAPIPLSRFFDTTLPVPGWGQRKKKALRRRFKHAKKASPAAPITTGTGARSNQFVLEGEIRTGNATKFSIGGTDFMLTPTTWVIGEIRLGTQARVKGVMQSGDECHATSIVMLG